MGHAKRRSSERISLKLPAPLAAKVASLAKRRGTSRSEVIRHAIQAADERTTGSGPIAT